MMEQVPSSYRFVPMPDRGPLKFPGGARVALIFTINIEYWEPSRPGHSAPLGATPAGYRANTERAQSSDLRHESVRNLLKSKPLDKMKRAKPL